MGFLGDIGSGINTLTGGLAGDAYNGVKSVFNNNAYNTHTPGVGGAVAPGTQLQQDPTTGAWYDPANPGKIYVDQAGQTPVQNPNIAQQVANNIAIRNQFNAKLAASGVQSNEAIGGLGGLATSLNNTINNPNAPSVAQTQLGIGLDAAAHQQLGGAAGVGGQNAFAARRAAMGNIGDLVARENQSAGLTRAGEVATAQGRLADVLGTKGGLAQSMYNANTGAGQGYSQMAQQGQEFNQTSQQLDEKNKRDFWDKIIGAAGQAGSVAATGGGGAPGGTTAGLGGLTAAV